MTLKDAFKALFAKKKEKDARHNHDFDDTDREYAITVRNEKAQIRKLRMQIEQERLKHELYEQRQELEQLKSEYDDSNNDYEEEESNNNPESLLTSLILKAFTPNPNTHTRTESGVVIEKINLTDDEIKSIIAQQPKHIINLAKTLPDETIIKFIKTKFPNLSDDTLLKSVSLMRT